MLTESNMSLKADYDLLYPEYERARQNFREAVQGPLEELWKVQQERDDAVIARDDMLREKDKVFEERDALKMKVEVYEPALGGVVPATKHLCYRLREVMDVSIIWS